MAETGNSKIVLQGAMNKQGGFFHSWKRRWFVLSKDRYLRYYADKSCKDMKGEINLTQVKEVTTAARPPNAFLVYCAVPKRIYTIQAATMDKRKEWMEAIRALSEGRQWPPKKKKKKKKTEHVSVRRSPEANPIVINNIVPYPQMAQPVALQMPAVHLSSLSAPTQPVVYMRQHSAPSPYYSTPMYGAAPTSITPQPVYAPSVGTAAPTAPTVYYPPEGQVEGANWLSTGTYGYNKSSSF